MNSTAPRTEVGHWQAGVSGNPGGYSKEKRQAVARVADLAREHTPKAIETLAAIMNDEKATRTTRIAAANALLDRAHGRPPQSVGIGVGLSFDDPSVSDDRQMSDIEIARHLAFVLAKGANAPPHGRPATSMPHPPAFPARRAGSRNTAPKELENDRRHRS